jgi:hypothetical protein
MGRIHYDVMPKADGPGWRVRTCGYACDCANQVEALVCAFLMAKDLWESFGAACDVRLQVADGQWREARCFGADDFP